LQCGGYTDDLDVGLSIQEGGRSITDDSVVIDDARLHPERRDPLLQFTVPEALAVIERASGNLRALLVGSFPLGDRITVAQLMWLYRWRGALQLAEKGYDLWRIVRLLNPIAAATQELRERFTRQLYEAGREHLAGRLARAFVKEVGRAAIDLYGGNLRVTAEQLRAHVSAASRADGRLPIRARSNCAAPDAPARTARFAPAALVPILEHQINDPGIGQ
jgi:hypothetical protein